MGRFQDIAGCRFGNAVALRRIEDHITSGGHKHAQYLCLCDCGKEFSARAAKLKNGSVKSCGCFRRKYAAERATTHGESNTRLYRIYKKMVDRCHNPSNKDYGYYGGRGIVVCDEWRDSFESFRAWAYDNGYAKDLTIERIDGDYNYNPGNCRWATRLEQANNLSSNHMITFQGDTKTVAEWSRECGIKYPTLLSRINTYGWSVERALFEPIRTRGGR